MKYYADGYLLQKNPSPVGGGHSVVDENNNLISHTTQQKKQLTNNEVETLAILKAAELCHFGDTISSDSKTAIGWINRGFSKVRPDLIPELRYCKEILIIKNIQLIWESREVNLAGHFNEAYDTSMPLSPGPALEYSETEPLGDAPKKLDLSYT